MAKRFLPPILLLLVLLVAAPASAQLRYVGDRGVITVGKVPCAGVPCELEAPKRVKAKIGQRSFWVRVIAPQRVAAGARAPVKVKFGGRALGALAGRTTTVEVRLRLRQRGETTTRLLRARLRRAALAGQPGDPSAPASGPLGSEPPLLARPATAVDVSDVQVSWYPRDSWVRYLSSGPGPNDGVFFSGGAGGVDSTASPCPDRPVASDAMLPYTAHFTPRPSWYDVISGAAGVYGQGATTFRWQARGIDLTAADPEIEINGAASRAIFRFSGSGATAYPNQRATLLSLDTSAGPVVTNAGKTFTYSFVRGRLTADGVNVFAGFYTPPTNDEFGCVSVSFTTP
jgi:hypothetical protein